MFQQFFYRKVTKEGTKCEKQAEGKSNCKIVNTVVVPRSKSIISLIPMMLLQIGVQMKQKIGMVRSTIKRHEEEEEMMPIKGAVVVGMQPSQSPNYVVDTLISDDDEELLGRQPTASKKESNVVNLLDDNSGQDEFIPASDDDAEAAYSTSLERTSNLLLGFQIILKTRRVQVRGRQRGGDEDMAHEVNKSTKISLMALSKGSL